MTTKSMSKDTRLTTSDESPVKAEGFCHLHLDVRDLARSVRFYREAFGLKVGFNAGKDLIFMVPKWKGQVESARGKFLSRGMHGDQYPYAYVADPDGYVIEV